jgi:hypothetical protein
MQQKSSENKLKWGLPVRILTEDVPAHCMHYIRCPSITYYGATYTYPPHALYLLSCMKPDHLQGIKYTDPPNCTVDVQAHL